MEQHHHTGKFPHHGTIGKSYYSWLIIFVVRISIFELPPFQHVAKAEKTEGGEIIGGGSAVEADRKAVAVAVETTTDHDVGGFFHFHSSKFSQRYLFFVILVTKQPQASLAACFCLI